MALTRTNPLHDLKQTAKDLATLIVYGESQELMKCLQEAKEIYQQPLTSWTTGVIYFLLGSRRRSDEIDKAIRELYIFDNDDCNQSESVKNLFERGGWEDTSFNTTLIRVMVRHLHNYDQTVLLPLPVVTELKALLIYEQARLLNEDQISKQQEVIDNLKVKKIDMSNELTKLARELSECEARLTALKLDEQSAVAAEHQKRQQALEEYQQEIKKLDAERQQQERVLAEIKLLSIKPTVDLGKLTEAQLKEMEHQVQVTIDLYLKDLEAKTNQSRELSSVTNNHAASKAKSQLQGLSFFRQEAQEKQAEDRQHEVQAVTSAANGLNESFKASLAKMLGSRVVQKQAAAKTKELYRTGQTVDNDAAKAALASVVVVNDYTPDAAPKMIAEAQAEAATATMIRQIKTVVQEQEKIDSEQFANAKASLAKMFANRQPSARVEAVKPLPSTMTI